MWAGRGFGLQEVAVCALIDKGMPDGNTGRASL